MNSVWEMEKRQHVLPKNKQPVTQTFSLIRVLGFAKKRDTVNFPYLSFSKEFQNNKQNAVIYWTTCFYQREGTINVIDQGSGNLSVIAVSFQERVITQPWYSCGMQRFRPPQKISLFYIWLIKAEFEWTGHRVEKEEREKQKLNWKRILGKLRIDFWECKHISAG